MWRAAIWRSSTLLSLIGVEKLSTSFLQSPASFTLTNGGGTAAAYKFFYNSASYALAGSPLGSYTTSGGGVSRINTSADINVTVGGDTDIPYTGRADSPPFTSEYPELQGAQGEYIVPTGAATQTTNAQGKIAQRFDWWVSYGGSSGTPVTGDVLGGFAFIALGPIVLWPWDNSTTPFIT